jgi:hypothetical protein
MIAIKYNRSLGGKDMRPSNFLPDKLFLKRLYRKRLDKTLDLKHPKTFNEKLQWLKLYDRKALYTTIADKYAVRHYISEKIGAQYLIPLLYQTEDVNEISAENLPDAPFIIKTNHDSSGGIIIQDTSDTDWKMIRKRLKKLLAKNYYYHAREWQYKHIKPRVIVEKLLTDRNGKTPYEYKLHCFHGKVEYIQVFIDKKIQSNIYNTKWELQPSFWTTEKPNIDFELHPPSTLKEMIRIAEILASGFFYLRVDLYNVEERIYFGELTLHDGAGLEVFNEGIDEKLGSLIHLPIE